MTITVVIPVYNVAPYVERCVQSVMRQTYPAAECVIVDDASPDCSISLCQKLIDEYSGPTKFTILRHAMNRGLSAARNTGTNAATSDYVYYLDSDDEMTANCLEKLVAPVLKDNSIEMVMGGHLVDHTAMAGPSRWLLGKNVRFVNKMPLELKDNKAVRQWFYKKKRVYNPMNVWNKLLKLSFIRQNALYNKEGQLWEDQLWALYLMRCLNHAAFIPSVTYICYRHPGSIVTETSEEEMTRQMGYIYRDFSKEIIPGKYIEETEHFLSDFCRFYIKAPGNHDYQVAYNAFIQQLSDGNHKHEVLRLRTVCCLSKRKWGRLLYKNTTKWTRIMRKILR